MYEGWAPDPGEVHASPGPRLALGLSPCAHSNLCGPNVGRRLSEVGAPSVCRV